MHFYLTKQLMLGFWAQVT